MNEFFIYLFYFNEFKLINKHFQFFFNLFLCMLLRLSTHSNVQSAMITDDTSSDSKESFLEQITPTTPKTARDYSTDVFIPLHELQPLELPTCRCKVSDDISMPNTLIDHDEAPPHPQIELCSDDDDDDDSDSKGKGPIKTRFQDQKPKKKKKKHPSDNHPASSSNGHPDMALSDDLDGQASRSASKKRRNHRNKRSGSSIAVSKELKKHLDKEKSLPPFPSTPSRT